jgi:hypothetical protein
MIAHSPAHRRIEALQRLVDAGYAHHAHALARRWEDVLDEPRDWKLIEEGYHYATEEHASLADAIESAVAGVDRANYGDAEGTIYISVSVYCGLTGEEASRTVTLNPDEPECVDGEEHDWQSPHEILGGLSENPGVMGHGGGVIVEEVCMRCGCARMTDTYAQDMSTGIQGYTSVSYEPGRYSEEVCDLRDAEQIRKQGWGSDVTRHDRVVVWGAGASTIERIRHAFSDYSYVEGARGALARARMWLDECERDDWWCVSLDPREVAASDLEDDDAVAGYSVVQP